MLNARSSRSDESINLPLSSTEKQNEPSQARRSTFTRKTGTVAALCLLALGHENLLIKGCSARSLLGTDTAQSDERHHKSQISDLAKVFQLEDPDVLVHDPFEMAAKRNQTERAEEIIADVDNQRQVDLSSELGQMTQML